MWFDIIIQGRINHGADSWFCHYLKQACSLDTAVPDTLPPSAAPTPKPNVCDGSNYIESFLRSVRVRVMMENWHYVAGGEPTVICVGFFGEAFMTLKTEVVHLEKNNRFCLIDNCLQHSPLVF